MAATAIASEETCGSCCDKLKELIKTYEVELGLDENNDGTKVHAFGSLNFCLEQNKFNDLLSSIHTKCAQCRGWPDSTRAARASMERLQQVENLAPVKNLLSDCLEKLQKSMRDTSQKDVVKRLEAITKQLGLKFYDSGTGTDCFISSDMFYVEVQMEHSGHVIEVKVAHAGDPEACPELTRVLREREYEEFINHLNGLSELYRLSGDTFQKSKIMMSLKAVEIDINMMDALHGPVENSVDTILHSPVGFVTPRQGGRLMRLTYFASPYELLDVDNPGQTLHFTREFPPPRDFGHWVCVSVEQSHKCLLPTMPLIEDPTVTETLDVEIKYQALNDNNSDELPASFVLQLNKPLVVSAEILGKIYQIVHTAGNFTHCSKVPLDKLVIREWLKEKKINRKETNLTFYVLLPEQHHMYHVNESGEDTDRSIANADLGLLVHRIPFTHPSHIPDILQLLRRQATFNTLLTSVLRSTEPLQQDESSETYVFEVSTSGPFTVTVTFENPCVPGMASVDFTVQEDHHVTATLHTAPRNTSFCRDDYIARVIQRCISIPVAMRSVIKKAANFKPGEQPVIGSNQELSTSFGHPTPDTSSKWMTLNIPPAGLFGTVMKTPTDPSTPGLFNPSPTFATFSLETPSPTVTVFPFTSISPSGPSSFPFTSTEGELMGGEATPAGVASKHGERKPLDTPRLPKITLKRKRDNEYVIENPELPKSDSSELEQGKMGNAQKAFAEAMEDDTVMEAAGPSFEFSEVTTGGLGGNFVISSSFPDTSVASDVPGQLLTSVGPSASSTGVSPGVAMAPHAASMAPGTELVGMVPSESLFDLPGSAGSGVEGILQNLPGGVSHLPPGIVPVSGAMDFDVGLGPGVAGMDVPVDATFDFDAAIDASTAADPSIAGTTGVVTPTAVAFDVDAMLSFDLDQIASSGTLPGGAITGDVTDTGDHGAGLMAWGQDLGDGVLGLETGGQGLGESMDGSSFGAERF